VDSVGEEKINSELGKQEKLREIVSTCYRTFTFLEGITLI
jgi:hypothetical protein